MRTNINLLLSSILLAGFCSLNLRAQDKNIFLGIQGGVFVPSNNYIEGYQTIYYSEGSPVGVLAPGFGYPGDINIRFQYFFTNAGIHFDAGARLADKEVRMNLAPDGDEEVYQNKLNIFPVELGIAYRFILKNEKAIPYYSAGIGLYYGTMEIQHEVENGGRDFYKGNAFSIGLYNAIGAYFAIYGDLMLNAEIKFNFASGNWEMEDQDEDAVEKYEKMNTGGTAFKVGLAFRF